jgi:hypothetical protein
MYLQALVESGVKAVPSKAIVAFEGSDYIFVADTEKIKRERLHQLPAKTGVTELNYTELILTVQPTGKNWKVLLMERKDLLSKNEK